MSEAATNPRPKNSTLIRRFLPYMAKYRGVLAFDLFCAALTTLCDIALPSIMRTLTNTVSAAALTVDTVLRLAALYFVLRIIDGAASYFMSGIGHIMGVHIETDMRRDAFDHLLRLDHTYYNNTKVGQIMGRITNDLFDVTEFAHHCPEEFFIAGIKIAASFVILCQASVPLTLVVFACVPLMGVVSVKLNRKLRERFRQQRFQIGELNATIEDSLLGQRVVKAFAAEDMEQIEYTYNGQTYTLQYSGGSWQLAQDPAYHLDESACNTMRTALMALNAKRSLTPQAGEDYGLDSPQLTVTVTAAGQSTTLTFGAENPVTGDLYVQKAGDDAIYTVSGNKVACFQLDKAGLFGSFCPTRLTASAITQVAYTLADGTSVTLNAVSEPTESADSTDADSASSSAYETVWRLASDPAASLAQDKVQSMLSALCTYATAQTTDADLSACGFDAPVFTAVVTSEDGSTVQLAYACGTDGWYLQVEGDTSVYTVDTSTVQALLLTENDLKTQE